MHFEPVPLIAAVFLFGAICQLIAWRLRIPPILFLLFTGILVGPLLGIVRERCIGIRYHNKKA